VSAQFRMSSEENRRWLPSRDPYTRSYDHGNIEDPPVCPAVSTRQGCLSVSVQRLSSEHPWTTTIVCAAYPSRLLSPYPFRMMPSL
jgi:hypothetical protein